MARTFKTVARLDELSEGEGLCVYADERMIALFKANGEIFATDNLCPHQGGPLADGFVHKGKVVCPLHGWTFDLRTGATTDGSGLPVAVYEVRVEGEEVQIGLEA